MDSRYSSSGRLLLASIPTNYIRKKGESSMFQKRRVDGKALVIVALLGVGVLSSTGCTAVTGLSNMFKFNNDLNEYIMNSRAYSMSGKAWHARKHCLSLIHI